MPLEKLPVTIKIRRPESCDNTVITVRTEDYIVSKTKDLIEFGFNGLSEKTVREELLMVLNKREGGSLIRGFIADDVVEDGGCGC